LEISKLKQEIKEARLLQEEVKEAPVKKETSVFESRAHPCFDFYNNLESLNINDLQFKKDYKYTIRHPYLITNPPTPIEKIP
jgi:hypothetical protein